MMEFKCTRPGFESVIKLDDETTICELIDAFRAFVVTAGYSNQLVEEYFAEE